MLIYLINVVFQRKLSGGDADVSGTAEAMDVSTSEKKKKKKKKRDNDEEQPTEEAAAEEGTVSKNIAAFNFILFSYIFIYSGGLGRKKEKEEKR